MEDGNKSQDNNPFQLLTVAFVGKRVENSTG
jgi:hypothetical protein